MITIDRFKQLWKPSLIGIACLASSMSASGSLVGLWRFEEDSGVNILDASGFENHGFLEAVPLGVLPTRQAGPPGLGKALDLKTNTDGFGEHWARVPHNYSLNLLDRFSIFAWVYDRGGNYGRIIDKGIDPITENASNSPYDLEGDAYGQDSVYFWSDNGADDFRQPGGFTLPKNEWVHFGITYDGQTLRFYLNGEEQSSVEMAAELLPNTSDLIIGNRLINGLEQGDDRAWNGLLDDVAIFNRPLAPAEIDTIATGNFAPFINSTRVTDPPSDLGGNFGETVNISVQASSNNPLTYQWRFFRSDIQDATSDTLAIPNVTAQSVGQYEVIIRDGDSAFITDTIRLEVNGAPIVVGLWRFDEVSGAESLDSSGFINHGNLVGEFTNFPTRVASQNGFGRALKFEVLSAIGSSFLRVAADDSLKVGVNTTDRWSMTMWTYEDSLGTGTHVQQFGRILTQQNEAGLAFTSGSPGNPFMRLRHGANAGFNIDFSGEPSVAPLVDQWVHWAVVYDGSSVTLYRNANQGVNGGKMVVPTTEVLDFQGYVGSLKVGGRNGLSPNQNWRGLIDEVAVFNGALREEDIQTVFTGDFNGFVEVIPAPIIVSQSATVNANEGDTSILRVGVESPVEVSYQWLFNGTPIPGEVTDTLILRNVDETMAGLYAVVVTNRGGLATSDLMTLNFLGKRNSLLALYRFDEASGDIAINSLDSTLNGTLVSTGGELPERIEGPSGYPGDGALRFFNNESVNKVTIPTDISFSLPADRNQLTVSAWVLPEQVPPSASTGVVSTQLGRILSFGVGMSVYLDNQDQVNLVTDGATPVGVAFLSNNINTLDNPAASVNVGEWTHVAFTYDEFIYRVYINGELAGELPNSDGIILQADVLNIANNLTNTGQFVGALDEVALFDTALKAEDINLVFQRDYSLFIEGENSPTILEQPVGATLELGGSHTFSVRAINAATYQWLKNGVEIVGATSATYQISSATEADIATYTVRLTNVEGTTVSNPVSIEMNLDRTSLVALYRFNEASGTVAVNETGAALNGTLVGVGASLPPARTLGYSEVQGDGSLRFYANKNINKVTLPQSSDFNRPAERNQISLSVWLRSETLDDSASPVSFGRIIEMATSQMNLIMDNLKDSETIGFSSQGINISGINGVTVPLGVWTHVVITYDEQTLKFYIDGTMVREVQDAGDIVNFNNPTIGNRAANDRQLSGSLDELAIFDIILTPAEVQQVMKGNFASFKVGDNPPVISSQPKSTDVEPGQTLILSVVATDAAEFQWFKNDVEIVGATSQVFTRENSVKADAGLYSVRISNAEGSVTSLPAQVNVEVVILPPVIVSEPQNATVTEGDQVTFLVEAQGLELNYQWFFNGNPIEGATLSSLNFDPVTLADSGGYSLQVSNSAGSDMSATITMTVNPIIVAPTIELQPSNVIAEIGDSVGLSVGVTGSAPMTFQWFFNGVAINGATLSTLSLGNVTLEVNGNYTVEITNASGSVLSNVARVQVIVPGVAPRVIGHPRSANVVEGDITAFAVVAIGTETLRYQWFHNGAVIPGATAFRYTISEVNQAHAGEYTCSVTNTVGSTTSLVAFLNVSKLVPAPEILAQPSVVRAPRGGEARIQVLVNGIDVSYQWMFQGSDIAGATDAELVIKPVTESNSGDYQVRVSTTGGSVVSDSITLEVGAEWKLLMRLSFESIVNGTVQDISGSGNNGLVETAEGWNQPEIVVGAPGSGNGIRFSPNATGYGAQWIRVVHNASLDLTDSFTIAAWVYDEGSNFGQIVDKALVPGTGNWGPSSYGLAADKFGKDSVYFFESNGAVGFREQSAGFTLPKNEWAHLAVSYDGAFLRYFLNGIEQKALPVKSALIPNLSDLIIGNRLANGLSRGDTRSWNGIIDELMIFDSAEFIPTIMDGSHPAFDIVPPAEPAPLVVGRSPLVNGGLEFKWPAEFDTYKLQYTDNLGQSAWVDFNVTAFEQDGWLKAVVQLNKGLPMRLFRLVPGDTPSGVVGGTDQEVNVSVTPDPAQPGGLVLAWPTSSTLYRVEYATTLLNPVWKPLSVLVTVQNGVNKVRISPNLALNAQVFRVVPVNNN